MKWENSDLESVSALNCKCLLSFCCACSRVDKLRGSTVNPQLQDFECSWFLSQRQLCKCSGNYESIWMLRLLLSSSGSAFSRTATPSVLCTQHLWLLSEYPVCCRDRNCPGHLLPMASHCACHGGPEWGQDWVWSESEPGPAGCCLISMIREDRDDTGRSLRPRMSPV